MEPSKVKGFVWKLKLGRVQTKENLQKRSILPNDSNNQCVFYNSKLKTVVVMKESTL